MVLLGAEILVVLAALFVAFHPNVLYAAVSLMITFLGIAVMFLYAGADFIAGAQVVIYVGGITMVILFAIMLTHWLYQIKLRDVWTKLLIPIVIVGLGLIPFLYKGLEFLANITVSASKESVNAFAAAPKTMEIGHALLNEYVLAFEGITILLLGALVGAVWLARPK